MNNACSTGSTALMLAKQLIQGGMANCVLALGFDKMERGSLTSRVCSHLPPKAAVSVYCLIDVALHVHTF